MSLSVSALFVAVFLRPYLKFIWHCFIRPIGLGDQKARLDKFYQGQADVYDATRDGLLRGRNTMLSLSAAHLKELRAASPHQRLVWVDIGGGHNIELMNKHMPILESFDAVYLIDLCEPLLAIARKRFAKKGWTNVMVLSDGRDPKGSVGFVTLSYSLSMIPSFYTLLDRIDHVLCPQNGLISVVDFYTAGKQPSLHEKAIGGASKECGWLSRWFWQIWFDFDHVSLSPARRSYLEYKFGTSRRSRVSMGRNRFIIPFGIVRIPYYIWLGGNMIGNCSPAPLKAIKDAEELIPSLQIGEPAIDVQHGESQAVAIDVTPPFSAFHYSTNRSWRLPYYDHPVHKEFRTFIYSFTWEDPFEDMKHLELSAEDSMFVITSAGDNALHYAVAASPKRIHCVDMNPCQGHLMELKLASIASLDYNDFFALFGDWPLLDSKIAPHLSSSAYQFWRINSDSFASSFYLRGYSGWALRLASILFRLAGVSKDIEAMCTADTLEQQAEIWKNKLRPVILNPVVVALLKNPGLLLECVGRGVYEFIRDTLDPLASAYLFKTGNYFYLLALLGHYTPESCPRYLTRTGFDALKADNGRVLDAFRLHTDSIVNVLRGLSDWSLTRALIMDHLDWFAPGDSDVDEEVAELHRALAPGGFVFWRSAARKPWYNVNFERRGFKVTTLGVRKGPEAALDRVNMYVHSRRSLLYASFWRAVKI
ncbi:hypothetical protein C8R46DRAFT_1157429 [Mycena filopes]|nr:hypothetical protein C8R46DRAFT_1157429 [Mycena filopes]